MQSNKTIISMEERRRQVAQLMQRSLTETEIAKQLKISTVCRDVQALKQVANQFVYDLAKQDLAYFYKDIIDDLNKARVKAWEVFDGCREHQQREKLLAIKMVIASNESMFRLLESGPTIMSVKSIQEQLNMLLERDKQQV